MRHTFATHFMMNGGNIVTLQRILDMPLFQQTMTYAHFSPDYLADAMKIQPGSRHGIYRQKESADKKPAECHIHSKRGQFSTGLFCWPEPTVTAMQCGDIAAVSSSIFLLSLPDYQKGSNSGEAHFQLQSVNESDTE